MRREQRGPQIFLSRTHPQFMAKLFTMEVPEIYDGIIEIKSVARDPGSRAKIAVISRDSSIDPVGACVGMRGSPRPGRRRRIAGREDRHHSVVASEPPTFVVNALQPAEVAKVVLDEDAERIEVVVPDEQLSLAIGRRGQNVRLASQLTGWDIDILTEAGGIGAPPEGIHRALDAVHGGARRRRDGRPGARLRRLHQRRGSRLCRRSARSPRSTASTRRPPRKSRPAPANISRSIEAEHDDKRKALGVADELREIPGITTAMMVTLGEDGIKTIEDFAGYAADDLVGWTERKDGETKVFPGVLAKSRCRATRPSRWFLQARLKAGWITEAELAAEEVPADEAVGA